MSRSRLLILVLVVIAVVGVSVLAIRTSFPSDEPAAMPADAPAGGATSATPAAPTPTASPSPTVDPVIAWADSVCAASFDIRDTLAATGDDLAVIPGPGALDEIRTRLERRGDTIIGQLEPLTVALGQVPVDVPEALRLASTLTGQVDALRSAADRAKRSIDALTRSDTVLGFGQSLPEAITAVGDAAAAARVLGATVASAAGEEGGRLGPGFRDSTVCQALIAGAPA